MTYTCMVDQGATLGWTAAPVLTDPTAVLFLAICPTDQRTQDCSAVSSIRCADLDFHATFKNVSDVKNGFANLISTFRFNATARLNETVVQCSTATVRGAPTASQSLIVAGNCFIAVDECEIANLHSLFSSRIRSKAVALQQVVLLDFAFPLLLCFHIIGLMLTFKIVMYIFIGHKNYK